ncbi:uncharacterized protein [Aegilops tauschii subsp. strangulata]|uniref:Uncharacterized protein n=2 Tax=Aegilops tauschii subsp. strangulata TaxID=200361 RepID=A0A453GZL1_AEGTS|nr:uncharacterized protein LOC109746026 isoform X1 [Aegilops tauschii subsp. strangulata]
MEVSARLRPPPSTTAPPRRGGGSLGRLLPSARPAARAVSAKPMQIRASAINDLQRSKSSLEALFCYDKAVPEENIGKPAGLDLEKKEVGKNPPCVRCETKGAVLCATCAGSGLYVDSIMESQGIIVKVRCLGCGGTGSIMCSTCGGRGHT